MKEEDILKILKEVDEISEFLSGLYDETSPDLLSSYLTTLNGYLARMPKLEAEAEYLRGYKKGEVADKIGATMTATVFREKAAGETAVYDKAYTFVYRLNQNLIEIQKGVISQLSYHKQQIPQNFNTEVSQKVEALSRQVQALIK